MNDARISADFGVWTDHCIPHNRSGWHPRVRQFYEYWLSVSPLGRLPGRQHISPEDMAPMLSRMWMLDVHRDPLRFRYRLYGTTNVNSLHHDLTGQWMDEVVPGTVSNPTVRDRFHFMAETGRPTWRRGKTNWARDPLHRIVENCVVPLAADGRSVDILMGFTMLFDSVGREIPG